MKPSCLFLKHIVDLRGRLLWVSSSLSFIYTSVKNKQTKKQTSKQTKSQHIATDHDDDEDDEDEDDDDGDDGYDDGDDYDDTNNTNSIRKYKKYVKRRAVFIFIVD